MPTDPFVPADLADRPRQQAEPPARRRAAARVELASPTGPAISVRRAAATASCSAVPGPNVGYAYTLAERVARTGCGSARTSTLDDAVAVVAEIAAKRAAIFGRAPVIDDVDVAIDAARLRRRRPTTPSSRSVRSSCTSAAHEYLRRRTMVDAVPESLLRKRMAEVAESVDAWRSQLADVSGPA